MRIVQVGFGEVGKENVRQLHMRGYHLAGIVDRKEVLDRIDLAGCGGLEGPPVLESELHICLEKVKPDVILLSTSYDPVHILEVVSQAAAAKCDVVAANGIVDITEIDSRLFEAIDRVAQEAGIRVLGVGIVPGFYSDLLPLFLTGVCASVTAVRFNWVTSFDKYGPDVMRRYGFGLSPAEFEHKTESGAIGLFERLWQSAHLIAHELGWPIVQTEEAKTGWPSDRQRKTTHMLVQPGEIGGFTHRIAIRSNEGRSIELGVTAYLQPKGDEEALSMTVELSGDPSICVDLSGDMLSSAGGLIGTSARMVNSIARLAAVEPGLRSVNDLPLVTCRDKQ
ncbi:hypothetical protein I6F11_28140 [Ensifer sp. NBAIM29]|nr:hypothetical protein [Ensifer sp. NBAIM29]